jgi:hypothetical protein
MLTCIMTIRDAAGISKKLTVRQLRYFLWLAKG